MACSINCIVGFGILLAVMDLVHAFSTLGFYGYKFINDHFFVCPLNLDIDKCHERIYIYDHLYSVRVNIGLGEGGITPVFVIFYIVALVKHKPYLIWVWLLKSFTIIGINVYYISGWTIRNDKFRHLNQLPEEYEDIFLYMGVALTIYQTVILLLFCLIGGIFSYKLDQERRGIQGMLHKVAPRFTKSGPALDPIVSCDNDSSTVQFNEEKISQSISDSTNKFPIPSSNGSTDQVMVERSDSPKSLHSVSDVSTKEPISISHPTVIIHQTIHEKEEKPNISNSTLKLPTTSAKSSRNQVEEEQRPNQNRVSTTPSLYSFDDDFETEEFESQDVNDSTQKPPTSR